MKLGSWFQRHVRISRPQASRDWAGYADMLGITADPAMAVPSRWRAPQLIGFAAAVMVSVLVAGWLFSQWWLLLAVPLLVVVMLRVVTVLRERARLRECHEALPDALMLMASALSAGHTLEQSLSSAVRAGGPLASEFVRVQTMVRLGETTADALDVMAGRLKSVDLHWVTIAIRINSTVGGDLGSLLRTLAATMRDREILRRTAHALSAEGRLSAWVLGLLPIGFIGLLLIVQPGHLAPLIADPRGWGIIGGAVLLFTVGFIWLRHAIKLEV